MKKKIIEDFKVYFNDLKVDLERDVQKYSEVDFVDLEPLQLGYRVLNRELERNREKVRGALDFIHSLGYISDSEYWTFWDITHDYYVNLDNRIDNIEDIKFKKYLDTKNPESVSTESAAC